MCMPFQNGTWIVKKQNFVFLYISYKLDGLKLHGVYKNINNMQKKLANL